MTIFLESLWFSPPLLLFLQRSSQFPIVFDCILLLRLCDGWLFCTAMSCDNPWRYGTNCNERAHILTTTSSTQARAIARRATHPRKCLRKKRGNVLEINSAHGDQKHKMQHDEPPPKERGQMYNQTQIHNKSQSIERKPNTYIQHLWKREKN